MSVFQRKNLFWYARIGALVKRDRVKIIVTERDGKKAYGIRRIGDEKTKVAKPTAKVEYPEEDVDPAEIPF